MDRFVFGGLAGCCATTCIQPLDLIKVRLQVLAEERARELAAQGAEAGARAETRSLGPIQVARLIVSENGVSGFYRGLSAALTRQLTYATARFGIYGAVSDAIKQKSGSDSLTFLQRAASGLVAGGLGAIVGTPADVALVRMQADAAAPEHARRNYANVFAALNHMRVNEGITSWWRGCAPTVYRAMAINVGQLAVYDQTKSMLIPKLGDSTTTFLLSSAVAGFGGAFLGLPFDFIKTTLQNMRPDPETKRMPYRNFADCAMKIFRTDPFAFYRTFPTFYVRLAPHSVIHFMFFELFMRSYRSVSGNEE